MKDEKIKPHNPNPPSTEGGAVGAGRAGNRLPKNIDELDVVLQINEIVGPEDPSLDPTNPANIARIYPKEVDEKKGN